MGYRGPIEPRRSASSSFADDAQKGQGCAKRFLDSEGLGGCAVRTRYKMFLRLAAPRRRSRVIAMWTIQRYREPLFVTLRGITKCPAEGRRSTSALFTRSGRKTVKAFRRALEGGGRKKASLRLCGTFHLTDFPWKKVKATLVVEIKPSSGARAPGAATEIWRVAQKGRKKAPKSTFLFAHAIPSLTPRRKSAEIRRLRRRRKPKEPNVPKGASFRRSPRYSPSLPRLKLPTLFAPATVAPCPGKKWSASRSNS